MRGGSSTRPAPDKRLSPSLRCRVPHTPPSRRAISHLARQYSSVAEAILDISVVHFPCSSLLLTYTTYVRFWLFAYSA
jgi:hypothetical protein